MGENIKSRNFCLTYLHLNDFTVNGPFLEYIYPCVNLLLINKYFFLFFRLKVR